MAQQQDQRQGGQADNEARRARRPAHGGRQDGHRGERPHHPDRGGDAPLVHGLPRDAGLPWGVQGEGDEADLPRGKNPRGNHGAGQAGDGGGDEGDCDDPGGV